MLLLLVVGGNLRFCATLKDTAPEGPRAGEEGWSVIVMDEAPASAAMMDGSAAPVDLLG
jgi:hypothetical protein